MIVLSIAASLMIIIAAATSMSVLHSEYSPLLRELERTGKTRSMAAYKAGIFYKKENYKKRNFS